MTGDEELACAATHYTAERLGALLMLVVESVARTHPDMLRAAMNRVMDLSAWEEEARRVRAVCQATQEALAQLRSEAAELRREIDLLRADVPGRGT